MSNILIIASAARVGGALTIIKNILNEALETEYNYTVIIDPIISKQLPISKKIKYIYVNTQSWIKRIIYDNFYYKKIINEDDYSFCLNLQNVPVRFKRLKQFVYYHQPLPLINYKFSPFKRDELKLFIYKHFYFLFVKLNKKFANKFIVQTMWVKEALAKKLDFNINYIFIIKPKINLSKIENNLYDNKINWLFYPAQAFSYKNHKLLIKIFEKIGKEYLERNNFRLYLTINDRDFPKLYQKVQELKLDNIIFFLGNLTKDETIFYYKQCKSLIFTSNIETYGLPLAEATYFGSYIIAGNHPFSNEILKDYPNKKICNPTSIKEWVDAVKELPSKNKMEKDNFDIQNENNDKILILLLKIK
ncbi:TPA: glycosyltransferase [Proteus mirabilis]|uniref:glycosyltransferase n=1 Tax=Proteus mirabilis TaxID=584 RepID=UPI001A1AC40E|nr:glycosyltransferase [Proteus mirabilis]MCT8228456.1 glycosyltransferase [Proteus mirabilis]MDF7247342.1 glycosyltransferase [Proteus mirabilis]MDF7406869.1 glycosyltransferase [Proteus mirabilis]MDF7431554.1 glycosyltransferase [Proteus mirabilis]HAT4484163.1 glycosyltransferase family 4 protein [Proteus mirabilis]